MSQSRMTGARAPVLGGATKRRMSDEESTQSESEDFVKERRRYRAQRSTLQRHHGPRRFKGDMSRVDNIAEGPSDDLLATTGQTGELRLPVSGLQEKFRRLAAGMIDCMGRLEDKHTSVCSLIRTSPTCWVRGWGAEEASHVNTV